MPLRNGFPPARPLPPLEEEEEVEKRCVHSEQCVCACGYITCGRFPLGMAETSLQPLQPGLCMHTNMHREEGLVRALRIRPDHDKIGDVEKKTEKYKDMQRKISKLGARIEHLKSWDPNDEDGRRMQEEARQKEKEVAVLKKQAENLMMEILQEVLEIEEKMEAVVDEDFDECRPGQRVLLSRRFAAYERYSQYAGWVGVLVERSGEKVKTKDSQAVFWKVHFPAMPVAAEGHGSVPSIELPVATRRGWHDEGSFGLIYAVPRFQRWAKMTMDKALAMHKSASVDLSDAKNQADAAARKEAKELAIGRQDKAQHMMNVARLEEIFSRTPIANGLSWLTPLVLGHLRNDPQCTCRHNAGGWGIQYEANPECPVKDGGVHWADGAVHGEDRWCHSGRQVVVTPEAAAEPHLAACSNIVGKLHKKIAPGEWAVNFDSLGTRYCRVGAQNVSQKHAEADRIAHFDLYYVQSPHSLAAETIANAKPACAREFLGMKSSFPDSMKVDAVLTYLDEDGEPDANGKPFRFGDALWADPGLTGVSVWFSPDTQDLVLESDICSCAEFPCVCLLCKAGTHVMLSPSAQDAHPEWVGMAGVLTKRTRVGQWLVRFPSTSLDRLITYAYLKTGLHGKFELVYADLKMRRVRVEARKIAAQDRAVLLEDVQRTEAEASAARAGKQTAADGVRMFQGDATLMVLNQMVQVVWRIESPDWRDQELALMHLAKLATPWMVLQDEFPLQRAARDELHPYPYPLTRQQKYAKFPLTSEQLKSYKQFMQDLDPSVRPRKRGSDAQPTSMQQTCHQAWALRGLKEAFQKSALWAPIKEAVLHLEIMPMLANLVLGLPATTSDKVRGRGASNDGHAAQIKSSVRVAAARVLGALLDEADPFHPAALKTLLGERRDGTGIMERDDAVRRASSAAFLMSVIEGDIAMLWKVVEVFLQPNIVTTGPASTVATVRRKVQVEVGNVMRHLANVNDPELVAKLVESVAMEPLDLARNQVVLLMLTPPREGADARERDARRKAPGSLVTRGSHVVVAAVLSHMHLILGHADMEVRKCGVSILAAVASEGDPDTTVHLAQMLAADAEMGNREHRLTCAAALRRVAGSNNLMAQARLQALAADVDWVKRLSAVRALALMASSKSVRDLCEFFEKIAARDESCAVRWTCLKAIRALTDSRIDPRVVLDDYHQERLELLTILRSSSSSQPQRVEAARVLGEMIRGADVEVVTLFLDFASREPNPIMRTLSINALQAIVTNWDESIVQGILPCLVDQDAIVRRSAIEALREKVQPGNKMVMFACIDFLHAPVVAKDEATAVFEVSLMSALRQRTLRQSVLQIIQRVGMAGDEEAKAMLLDILLEENRKSQKTKDPEDAASQSMELYSAVVEALGFLVVGRQRGLVIMLREELKLARMIQEAREAQRPQSRAGQSSRSSSSRAASRLDKDLASLDVEEEEGNEEEDVGKFCVEDERAEPRGHDVESRDEMAGEISDVRPQRDETAQEILQEQRIDAEAMELERLLPGVLPVWVARYLRVAMGLISGHSEKSSSKTATTSNKTGQRTDPLYERSQSLLSQSVGGTVGEEGRSVAGRTAPSTIRSSGQGSKASRVKSSKRTKSSLSGMSTSSPEFLNLVDVDAFNMFALQPRRGPERGDAKEESRPSRPTSRATGSSVSSGCTSLSTGSKRVEEDDVDEARVTLVTLKKLLVSKNYIPHVFSRDIVVKTFQNIISERAPLIAKLKKRMRIMQSEHSVSDAQVLSLQIKLALSLTKRAEKCGQQVMDLDLAIRDLVTKLTEEEDEFKERLQEHIHELHSHTWAIVARPDTSEMLRLVWENGELKIQEKQSGDSEDSRVEAPEGEEEKVKIGAQFSYDQALARLEALKRRLEEDSKLPKKSEILAQLAAEESKVSSRAATTAKCIQRLESKMLRTAAKSQRLADVLEEAENDRDMDVFGMLDYLEHQTRGLPLGSHAALSKAGGRGREGDHSRGQEEEKEKEEEEEGKVPLAVIQRYRQLAVDLNFELADQGTCAVQLSELRQKMALLLVTEEEASEEGSNMDDQAFADANELHRQLTRMAGIAERHKAAIRRRKLLQGALARKQREMSAVLERVQRCKHVLLEMEGSVQVLDTRDEMSGVLGGEAGAQRRAATEATLAGLPIEVLRGICRQYVVRAPGPNDGKDERVIKALVQKVYANDVADLREKAKDLRKEIGLLSTEPADECDKFKEADSDDEEAEAHSASASGRNMRRGLRGMYLMLRGELRSAQRELRLLKESEQSYRMEWVSFHAGLRTRESYARRRSPVLGKEGAARQALREELEAATQAVIDCRAHLTNLTRQSGEQAQAIKGIELEVKRHSSVTAYRASCLRMEIEQVSRSFQGIRREMEDCPGVGLEHSLDCVRQMLLSVAALSTRVQSVLQHVESFQRYIVNGADERFATEVPELDDILSKELQVVLKELAEERKAMVSELKQPQTAVRDIARLQKQLHRLQHGLTYPEFYTFCTRLAPKANPPRPPATTLATTRLRDFSAEAAAARSRCALYFGSTWPKVPKVVKSKIIAKTLERKASRAEEAQHEVKANMHFVDRAGLSFAGFKEALRAKGLLPWCISSAAAEEVFTMVVPGYAQTAKARERAGIKAMVPFEEPIIEHRAPDALLKTLFEQVGEYINRNPVPDPRDPMRRKKRRKRALLDEEEEEEEESEKTATQNQREEPRRWLRKASEHAISSGKRSATHAEYAVADGIVVRTDGVKHEVKVLRNLPPGETFSATNAQFTWTMASAFRQRRAQVRAEYAASEWDYAAQEWRKVIRKHRTRAMVGHGSGKSGSRPLKQLAVHVNHWLLHIDGDFLGYDREAGFAVSADAQYVVMPGAVSEGTPMMFRVAAVLGRWRMLVVGPSTDEGIINRFKGGALCVHGVPRHLCGQRQCTGGDMLTKGEPLLVVSGSSVMACMGVLAPAVHTGTKVRIRKSWCDSGSGEPTKYSQLLEIHGKPGIVGTLHKNVAPGLWTILWPSALVHQSQFNEPFPLHGAPGQGLAATVVMDLKYRMDERFSTAADQEDFVARILRMVCAYANVSPTRIDVISRHDASKHATQKQIKLKISRSQSTDPRSPSEVAEECVRMINSDLMHGLMKEVDGARLIVYGARSREPVELASLEYAGSFTERVHLSQIRRVMPPSALERHCLRVYSRSVANLQTVVRVKAVGGVGMHSSILHRFAMQHPPSSVEEEKDAQMLRRRVLLEILQAVLPEYAHTRYEECVRYMAEDLCILDVQTEGFELIKARQEQEKKLQNRSFRSQRVHAMRRLGKNIKLAHGLAEEAVAIHSHHQQSPINDKKNERYVRAQERKMQLAVVLRVEISRAILSCLPDTNLSNEELRHFYEDLNRSREAKKKRGAGVQNSAKGDSSGLEERSVEGEGAGLRDLSIVLATRMVHVLSDPDSLLYKQRDKSIVCEMMKEGSTFQGELELMNRQSTSEVLREHQASGSAKNVGAMRADLGTLPKTVDILAAMLQGSAPNLGMLTRQTTCEHNLVRSECKDCMNPWKELLERCQGDLYAAVRAISAAKTLWWAALRARTTAQYAMVIQSWRSAKGSHTWQGADQGVVVDTAEPDSAEPEGEKVVKEDHVCAGCGIGGGAGEARHMGRFRKRGRSFGAAAAAFALWAPECINCRGHSCAVGARVRVRSCVSTLPLAAFKDVDGFLAGPCEQGCWNVAFVGAEGGLFPANVGKGGEYDLCYAPGAIAKHAQDKSQWMIWMSHTGTVDSMDISHISHSRLKSASRGAVQSGGFEKLLRRLLYKPPKLKKPMKEDYFGRRMNRRQGAALGWVWNESEDAHEDLVLPHTARAGARVVVSRRWSRIPFKHLQPSHARYAKFLERVGVLTRPAIGGSWYVAFQGLSGEYAFMVSAGVKSLAFVPAFYSSAVSLVRGNGGSAAEAAEVSIHFSFCYSRAFGPGDTVHVHLPGFFIGGHRRPRAARELAVETAVRRMEETAAAAQHARNASDAAADAAADAAEDQRKVTAANAARAAAERAENEAAAAAAAVSRTVEGWTIKGPDVEALRAMKQTPVLNGACASDMSMPVFPRNLAALSEKVQTHEACAEAVAGASWQDEGGGQDRPPKCNGKTVGISAAMFPDAEWDQGSQVLTLRCSTHVRAGQAIALRLPVAARVVPPSLPPGEASSGDVTISARTVAGDVGPVLVDVQPGRPTFQDCLVTIGGVAGLEALADELRAASALLVSARGTDRSRGIGAGERKKSKKTKGAQTLSDGDGQPGSGGGDGTKATVLRLERHVHRLRRRLLKVLGDVGDRANGSAVRVGEQDIELGVEVQVKWSHSHDLGPAHSVLVFVPGLVLRVEESMAGESSEGTGDDDSVLMAATGIYGSAEGLGAVSGGIGGAETPRWLAGVSARPTHAGVMLIVSLQGMIPANLRVGLRVKGGSGVRLVVDPDLAHETAVSRLYSSASQMRSHTASHVGLHSAWMGLLVGAVGEQSMQDKIVCTTSGLRGFSRRRVVGDLEVPLVWTQTSQPSGGRLHSSTSRACTKSINRANTARLASAARRWTLALGSPPPKLVAEWLQNAYVAAGNVEVESSGSQTVQGQAGLGSSVAVANEQQRERARARESEVAQGMYAWFRAAFEAFRLSPAAGRTPASVFHRLLLATTPLKGLGAGKIEPGDVRCLLNNIAHVMGAMPNMPGPNMYWQGQLQGTVMLPMSASRTLERYPTVSRHERSRVMLAANYLAALGWRKIYLSRVFGPRGKLWGPRHESFSRPPASMPTYALGRYYVQKFRTWRKEAGRVEEWDLWEWLSLELEAITHSEAEEAERRKEPPARYNYDNKAELFVRGTHVENVEKQDVNMLLDDDEGQHTFDFRGERWTCLLRLPFETGRGFRQMLAGLNLYMVFGLGVSEEKQRASQHGMDSLTLRQIKSLKPYRTKDQRVSLRSNASVGDAASSGGSQSDSKKTDEGGEDDRSNGDLWEAEISLGPDDALSDALVETVKHLLGSGAVFAHHDLLAFVQTKAVHDVSIRDEYELAHAIVHGIRNTDRQDTTQDPSLENTTRTFEKIYREVHDRAGRDRRLTYPEYLANLQPFRWGAAVPLSEKIGWKEWVGEGLIVGRRREGVLNRSVPLSPPPRVAALSQSGLEGGVEDSDSDDADEGGRGTGAKEKDGVNWYVSFDGKKHAGQRKPPEDGPFTCKRTSSMLELSVHTREEGVEARKARAVRVREGRHEAEVSQQVRKLELEVVMNTPLDESQLRAIAKTSLSIMPNLHALDSGTTCVGGAKNREGSGGEGAEADRESVGLGVHRHVETPSIRRGKDVVFHSARAGEEVELKKDWARDGRRKFTRLTQALPAALVKRQQVLQLSVAAIRADLKSTRRNLSELPHRSRYSEAELRMCVGRNGHASQVATTDANGLRMVLQPATVAIDGFIGAMEKGSTLKPAHMLQALAAAEERFCQDLREVRQQIAQRHKDAIAQRHKDAIAQQDAGGLGRGGCAGAGSGLRGKLTRPGPGGSWYVQFVDEDGEQESDDKDEMDEKKGEGTGATRGEEGPFPCNNDNRALVYPLVPSLPPGPLRPINLDSASEVAQEAGTRARAGGKPAPPSSKRHSGGEKPRKTPAEHPGTAGVGGMNQVFAEPGSGSRDQAGTGMGGLQETVLRVAVARARICVNISTEMLVQWLYSVFGPTDTEIYLYSEALRQHAIDGDLLLSLTSDDMEDAIETTKKRLLAPPHFSPNKKVEALGLYRHSLPEVGAVLTGEGKDKEGVEVLVSIYLDESAKRPDAVGDEGSSSSTISAAFYDTDWGLLTRELVTVVSADEAKEWRQRQRAHVRSHMKSILALAKTSGDPEVGMLAEMVWSLQPSTPLNKISEGALVRLLLGARFSYEHVAAILGVPINAVEKLRDAAARGEEGGRQRELAEVQEGFEEVVRVDVANYERSGGQGPELIERSAAFRQEIADKLMGLLIDLSHPATFEVRDRLRLLQALRRKTLHTNGWAQGAVVFSGEERDSWLVNSDGLSYQNLFYTALENKAKQDKLKKGNEPSEASSAPGDQKELASPGAAGGDVGDKGKGDAEQVDERDVKEKQNEAEAEAEKRRQMIQKLTEEEVGWGVSKAALLDCGIDIENGRLGQDNSPFKAILDPIPKVPRQWECEQMASWVKTLGFDAESEATYSRQILNHQVSSRKVLEWRQDSRLGEARLKNSLLMNNLLHRRRFWSSLDLLSSVLCWDVLMEGEVSVDQIIALLKSIKGAILAKYSTMSNAFKAIDADNSGAISRDELLKEISGHRIRVPPMYVQVILELADSDGSGDVQFKEFKDIWSNLDTPATYTRLEGILARLSGQQEQEQSVDASAAEKRKHQEWQAIGTKETWLHIQAEHSVISQEEGLISFKGRTYEMQDPGQNQVLVVDVETDEIIYWNTLFKFSAQDLVDWRKRQFDKIRADMLKSKTLEIETVETALLQEQPKLALLAQQRAAARAAEKVKAQRLKAADARKKSLGRGGEEKAEPEALGEGEGEGEGVASRDTTDEGKGVKEGRKELVETRAGALHRREREMKSKTGAMMKMMREIPLASGALQLPKKDWIPTIAKRIASESVVAATAIEDATFVRAANLLYFILESVWADIVPPDAQSGEAAGSVRNLLCMPSIRKSADGRALNFTIKAQKSGGIGTLSHNDVMCGVWCLVNLPPGLKPGANFHATVGGLAVSGVCPAWYGGEEEVEMVLGPLVDLTRTEWMVSDGSDCHVAEGTDLLECAKRHPDFFKRDLYVTQHSLCKFLEVALGFARKSVKGKCRRFVFTAKTLLKRLRDAGYKNEAKAGTDESSIAAGT